MVAKYDLFAPRNVQTPETEDLFAKRNVKSENQSGDFLAKRNVLNFSVIIAVKFKLEANRD